MERLKRWLVERGLKQKIFAESVDISESTLTRYLNGEREPDIETLKRLSLKTGLSIDELVGHKSGKGRSSSTLSAA